jgi:iron complex outermembrane receptor protein
VSGLAIVIASTPALAQNAATAEVEQVVVTGSNLRGVAPVGQNLVQVNRQAIETTAAVSVQDLLRQTVPQLNMFANAGQEAGAFEPRLRSLGGSSSAATLVLVDGHRISPGGGTFNTVADPNVVPTGAVERVEVLPDGASAVYGSDAVAGVINVITRKNYNGAEASGQLGFADSYRTRSGNLVFGHAWDGGSVIASYGYTFASDLFAGDRSFVSGNQSNSGPGATGRGGSNFNNFACSPATFVPSAGQPGAGLVFAAPYTGAGIVNNPNTNGLCSSARNQDILPQVEAHRLYVSARQGFGEHVKLSGTLIYSLQNALNKTARGTISNAAVFGPGSSPPGGAGQINPFFQGPPGVNRGTVSFNFDDLFPGNTLNYTKTQTITGTLTGDIELGKEWYAGFTLTAGAPTVTTLRTGAICTVCAYRALNGTVSQTGSTTAASAVPLNLPLTTQNALDVWGSPNRTPTSILQGLLDSNTSSRNVRPIYDALGNVGGPLFALPAGAIRVAAGGEFMVVGRQSESVNNTTLGPASVSSSLSEFSPPARHVTSVFAEAAVPLVSDAMAVPLVYSLDFNVSGRIDHYSDLAPAVRTTKNPRFGATWKPIADLALRSSYSTSFTAPNVGQTAIDDGSGTYGDFFVSGQSSISLPQGFPNRQLLGCPATGVCTLTSSSGKNGMVYFSQTNPDLRPQTGRNFSLGFDYAPSSVRGLRLSVSYWKAQYRNIISNITNATQGLSTPGLEYLLTINPTPAQIAAIAGPRRQVSQLNSPIAFIYSQGNYNMFNIRGKGIDFQATYELFTPYGRFTFDASGEYKFDWFRQTGTSPWLVATNLGNPSNNFAPLRFVGRADLAWREGPWRADLAANYVGSYYVLDGSPAYANHPCPPGSNTNDLGCARVSDYLTFDAGVQYIVPGKGLLSGVQASVNVRNLLNRNPPFYDSPNATNGRAGSGATAAAANDWANPIGRQVIFGLRKRW